MFAARSETYNLDRTCRCCLRDMTRMISLDKVNHNIDDKAMKPMTFGEKLMEIASIQIYSDDGLPQKMCKKCISALEPAFVFQQMCRDSDFKLREYFRQPSNASVCVKEIHFEDVDAAYEPETETKFEINFIDDSPSMEQMPQSDAISGSGDETGRNEILDDDFLGFDADANPNERTKVAEPEAELVAVPNPSGTSVAETDATGNAKPKLYSCKLCKSSMRSYAWLASYKRHMSRHKHAKRYTCDICQKQFTEKRNLEAHMGTHYPERYSELCSLCGKTFRNNSRFESHMLVAHSGNLRPFSCDICSKTFQQKSYMATHRKRHLLVKPHACSICSKTFITTDKLARHIRTHTGERPYKCEICKKAFGTDTVLKAHIRIHTGETPFQCKCGMKFSQTQSLLKHRRKFDHFDETAIRPPKLQLV